MEPRKLTRSRPRVYTPHGELAPKQKEITRISTTFEPGPGRKMENGTRHRRATAHWQNVEMRLETSRAEKRGSEDSFPAFPAEVLRRRSPLGELVNILADNNNNNNASESENWEAAIDHQDYAYPADNTNKENQVPAGISSIRKKKRGRALQPRLPSDMSLDAHETTQFPLEAANIPGATTRSKYTLFASPKKPAQKLEAHTFPWPPPSTPPPTSPLPPPPHPPRTNNNNNANTLWGRPTSAPPTNPLPLPPSSKPKSISFWGPSGPPPTIPLPPIPPEIARAARKAKENEKAWNRQLRAEERGGMGKREVTEFDLTFCPDIEIGG